MYRRRDMNQPLGQPPLTLVLLGKTGAGKSATGNTIIAGQGKSFKEGFSPESLTMFCQIAHTQVDRQTITVMDTVGLPDTRESIKEDQISRIEQMFSHAPDGVDVFLLVIRLGRTFTEESRGVVKWIQENFGEKFLRHTSVLFTHGDELHDTTIEHYINESEALRSVVDQCSGGFHVFNNRDEDPSQVTELLVKINALREKNNDRRYMEQDYKEIQDEILSKKCKIGALKGAVGGAAVGGALVAKAGALALTVGKAAVVGTAGGAILIAAGVYLFARKYIPVNSRNVN